MLVLSRYAGESIVINEDVIVTILSVKGDAVRIGADAPNDVPVHREEIHNKIMAQRIDEK